MVYPLWNAAAEGKLDEVLELLKDASTVDIEIKDESGVTPLIQAVKNGHVEVVRALLDKGADPTNADSQGPPEQHTTDPVILELLNAAKAKINGESVPAPTEEFVYRHDHMMDPSKGYYGPPAGVYYYPGMPAPPPMMPDGTTYYPSPPLPAGHNPAGLGNLPPPEIARMIPCRYYPACRYGSSCIFAHPQAPYIQGPLPPPAHYPAPYDPMSAPYPPPTYYAVPSAFPTSPNDASPLSPPPGPQPLPMPMGHARSGSEVLSPVQPPFSPNGGPPHMPYGMMPPVSPPYGHPGQAPIPIPAAPLSPSQQNGHAGPQSPQQSMYPPMSPVAHGAMPAYAMPPQSMPYPPMMPDGIPQEGPKSPIHAPQMDGYGSPNGHREFMGHHRRGSARRPSFAGPGRKPPCAFFPTGRCRNGDECRFPHVLPPDGPQYPHPPPHFGARGGHRPRGPPPHPQPNGFGTLEDKFAAMVVQDERQILHNRTNTNGTNGTAHSSRSQSTDGGNARRIPNGFRPNGMQSGARPEKKFAQPRPQRLPGADEFPVLGGNATPPLRSPGLNGTNGYAQVLQAPPPPRKEGESSVNGSTPEPPASQKQEKTEVNGVNGISHAQPIQEPIPVSKTPISFAAAAAAASAAVTSDAAKEVSVTA